MAVYMRIVSDAIIFETQERGGVSRIYQEIFPRICELEKEIRIELLTSGKLKQKLPTHTNITTHFFPPLEYLMRPARAYFAARKRLRAFLQYAVTTVPRDALWHSTYYTLPYRWQGATAVTVHDLIIERFPAMFKGAVFDHSRRHKEACIRSADVVLTISETTKQDVLDWYQLDASRCYVVPLAHSPVFTTQEYDDSMMCSPFLLYVGGRRNYKNFQRLLTAYTHWPRSEEVALIVVGEPWSSDEKVAISHAHVQDQIKLITQADDQTLCRLYNQALAFVYPSLYEGFGIPLLEAMACNCPIVASDIPSTREVADSYPLYFEPESEEALLATLEMAYEQAITIKAQKDGKKRAAQYSWDLTAKNTLAIYQALGAVPK